MARYQAGLRTEANIIGATRDLLGEVGLEGTTLKAICDRAGVRAGSFYNLFDSKEAAILRVVGEAMLAVDPDPEGRGTETLADLVQAYVDFIATQPAAARIYLQIAVSGLLTDSALERRFHRHHEQRIDRYRSAILRRQPSLTVEEATARAELVLATLNGLTLHWVLHPQFDFQGHAERLLAEVATD